MELTAIEVNGTKDHEYSLSWDFKGDHYHVWLNPQDHSIRGGVGTRKGLYKRRDGVDKVGMLDHTIAKNTAMIGEALGIATRNHLFDHCDAANAQKEKARLAKAAEEYKVTLAEKAGPKLLAVLRSIEEFWKINRDMPLSPGALIVDDRYQTISEAVHAAITLAETGGAVQL